MCEGLGGGGGGGGEVICSMLEGQAANHRERGGGKREMSFTARR